MNRSKIVRFNASEIGEVLGLLSQYRPNDSLPRLICRDSYAYLANRYSWQVPIRASKDQETAGKLETHVADKLGQTIVNAVDIAGKEDEILLMEELEHSMASEVITKSKILATDEKELEHFAEDMPLFMDDSEVISKVIEKMIPKSTSIPESVPVPISVPDPESIKITGMDVPETPANSFSESISEPGIGTSLTKLEIQTAKRRRMDKIKSILEAAAEGEKRVHETIQRETYTRHGIRTESDTLRKIEKLRDTEISEVRTIGITLDPEDILDKYDTYTETVIRITGRPDGVDEKTGQFIEIKNRVNYMTGKPRRYEMGQVLVYGLMSEKPVIFVEMNKKTGEIGMHEIEYSDKKFKPLVSGLVRLADYIVYARESENELAALASMDAESLSKKTIEILSGKK